jgi:hypothetical protein
MGAADAHCCASMAVFLIYITLFLQVASFPNDLNTKTKVQRGMYISLEVNDWKQAVIGTTGEWQVQQAVGGLVVARGDASLPIAGSIFAGVLLGFLLLMLLIGVYACFMAMPESHWSYIFLEPRFLIMLNAALVMMAEYAVQNSFVHCYCPGCIQPAVLCVLFALFSIVTCWADLIFLGLKESLFKVCKMALLLAMGIIPAFASVIVNVTLLFKVLAWVICIISSIMSVVDYIFASSSSSSSAKQPAVVRREEAAPPAAPLQGDSAASVDTVSEYREKFRDPQQQQQTLFQQFVMKDSSWMMTDGAPTKASKKIA